jgi:glycerol-3-phosphate O-acyltransferase
MSDTALIPAPARRALRGFGMNQRLGPALRWFARRYVDDIPYPEDVAERVRALSEQGTVVYVHRSRNLAEYLALQSAAFQHHLPEAQFVGGLNVGVVQPWWRFPRTGSSRGTPAGLTPDEWRLKLCVSSGLSAQLFLRRPLTLMTGSTRQPDRFVEMLIEIAREAERPIFLVPHFLALRSEPGSFEPTAADAIFGSADAPGHLRALARLMLSRGIARWEVSEPIDLTSFVKDAEHKTTPPVTLARKVRWVLLHHLARIERLSHGPQLKSHARMREETFRDAILQRQLNEISEETHQSLDELYVQAREIYDEIAARPDFDLARLTDYAFRPIWKLIYDGIHIDQRDIDRMRQAARDGPVILVPSHRSHMDYMMVSATFLWNGLLPPHGAAGINLNFFPVGAFLRRMGAFFLRRTFKGDKVYAAVFRAYVRRLYREGFTQEFFIEGGRSRTGKTLPPKMGFLSMLVEAYVEGRQRDAIFVPTHISFEKIIESGAYMRELGGGEKERETAVALIKSTGGILRSRYGRVFVTFDEPISLAGFLESHHAPRESLRDPEGAGPRRTIVQRLAYRIVHGINSAVVVTANALAVTALFGYRRRGLAEPLLEETVKMALRHIRRVTDDKVRLAAGLTNEPERALALALERLEVDGKVMKESTSDTAYYRIADSAFLELDFYKNNIIHFFVPEAIMATSMRALGAKASEPLARADVMERAQWFSRTFRHEFIFGEGRFEDLFDRTLARAEHYEVVTQDDDTITLNGTDEARRWAGFVANLLSNFVDSYWSAGAHVAELLAQPMPRKTAELKLLDKCRGDFLSGKLACPEAVSKSNLSFALTALVEAGALAETEGQLSLTDNADEVLEAFRSRLAEAKLRSR